MIRSADRERLFLWVESTIIESRLLSSRFRYLAVLRLAPGKLRDAGRVAWWNEWRWSWQVAPYLWWV